MSLLQLVSPLLVSRSIRHRVRSPLRRPALVPLPALAPCAALALRAARLPGAAVALALLGGCSPGGEAGAQPAGISPRTMADALHAVMESDRTVYTRKVVHRLQNEEKVIKASEHWEDEKALPLPAQMFRMGAEMVAEKKAGFTYALLSKWPVNKQNSPRTEAETAGLDFVAANLDQNFYAEETLGGQKYFTAVYADKAVAPACIDCHNTHPDSPRSDFKLGEVMGGVVIRIPQ